MSHISHLLAVAGTLVSTACSTGSGSAPGTAAGRAARTAPGEADAQVASSGDARISLPVVAAPARKGDLVLTVNTTGQVRSNAVSRLRAEVTGTVVAVHVRPGDQVKRGDAIVTFDPRPFDLAMRTAEIAVQEAMLRAQDNYVPDSIASGKAPSAERRRNAELRNGVDASRAKLDQARLDRERSVIRAPYDGVVDQVDVAAGERVTSGTDIATVVDLARLRVEASVLEHDLPLMKVGGTAQVSSATAPNSVVNGRVLSVLPLVDSTTRSGRVYVQLEDNGVLRPGMYVDVRLEATRLTNRVVVPDRAVIERDGRPLVFVVKDDRAQWVYVNPGRSNGREREILPDSVTGEVPIKAGDLVITEGHLTLTHDAPVRVVAKREGGHP